MCNELECAKQSTVDLININITREQSSAIMQASVIWSVLVF